MLSQTYRSWGEMVRDALSIEIENRREIGHREIVYISGMGGSGIVGRFIERLSKTESLGRPGLLVVSGREPELPPVFLSRRDDVFLVLVSYSGNTAETLRVFRRAVDTGLAMGIVTSGGRLYSEARDRGVPVFRVRQGLLPRASLPYLLIGSLRLLELLGVSIEPLYNSLRDIDRVLREYERASEDLSEKIEEDLRERRRVLFVSTHRYEPLVERFMTEYAENTKIYVETAVFPEAGHNFIETLKDPRETTIYYLSDPEDLEAVLIEGLLEKISVALGHIRVYSLPLPRGAGYLVKILAGAYLAGLSSSLLAERLGIDPSETSLIRQYRDYVYEFYMTR